MPVLSLQGGCGLWTAFEIQQIWVDVVSGLAVKLPQCLQQFVPPCLAWIRPDIGSAITGELAMFSDVIQPCSEVGVVAAS
jgi:hypothetical protein